MEKIFNEILAERKRQFEKFGEQNHNPIKWISILAEELGEASQCLVDANFGYKNREESLLNLRKELIQTAAVGHQMIEVNARLNGDKNLDILDVDGFRQFNAGMSVNKHIGISGDDLLFMWIGFISKEFGEAAEAATKLIESNKMMQRGMYVATLCILVTNCIICIETLDQQLISEVKIPNID